MTDTAPNRSHSTRRALLGGLTLGAAAIVAETVRPSPAQAATGDPVYLGGVNSADISTTLNNDGSAGTTSGNALELDGANFGGSGLVAYSHGGGAAAIYAAGDGDGLKAIGNVNGVSGGSANSAASGVYGENDGSGFGVAGRSNGASGTGVFGEALGTEGIALRGLSGSGGTALKVEGKAQFSRSGKKTIPAGASNAVVTLAGVTTASMILTTLQKHAAGFAIESAVPAAGSFRIWLNKPAPAGGLPVAWFVLN